MREVELRGAGGVAVRAFHLGPRDGAPVLVALPLATRPSFVAPALRALARRFRVYTWEARLMLDTRATFDAPGELSLEAHARDAAALLERFGLEQAALVGYCSGAALALHLCARLPGRFARLALVSGAYFLRPEQCELTQYERDVLALAPQMAQSRARAARIHSDFFAEGRAFRRRAHEFADEILRPYADAESLYRFGSGLLALIEGDSQAVARRVSVPALVAWGGRDDQTHPGSSALVAAALHGCEAHFDPELDHYALCRAHEGLVSRVAGFLGQA